MWILLQGVGFKRWNTVEAKLLVALGMLLLVQISKSRGRACTGVSSFDLREGVEWVWRLFPLQYLDVGLYFRLYFIVFHRQIAGQAPLTSVFSLE